MDFHTKKMQSVSFLRSFPGLFRIPKFIVLACLLHGGFSSASDSVDLTPTKRLNAMVRVKTIVEVEGSLRIPTGDKTSQLPIKVKAEVFYDERNLGDAAEESLRHYWNASADLTVNKIESTRKLRDERQVILVTRERDERAIVRSPLGPLTREELDLVDYSSSGFVPEMLLPSKQVSEGDHWKHTDDVVVALLSVDNILTGELTSTVKNLGDEVTKIDLAGSVDAEIDGVDTTIEVVGNYQFDSKTKIVKWLALSLKEVRDAGFGTPGFEVVARIRAARQAIDSSDALSDQLVTTLDGTRTQQTGDLLLEFSADNHEYQMTLDRRWYVMSQQADAVMLRMVDDGDLLATCKIDRLNKMAPGKQVTLQGFQQDVQRALGKNCEQILQAAESVNPYGVRTLRVVALGKAGDAKVHWIYYHLSDKTGRRMSHIFTHEASLAKQFATMDEALTSSVQFRDDEKQARTKSKQGLR